MQSRFEQLRQSRLAKLQSLSAVGIEPYAGDAIPGRRMAAALQTEYETTSDEELAAEPVQAAVGGRVVSLRPQGRAGFLHLQDGNGRIQVYVVAGELSEESQAVWRHLDLGDILAAEGRLMRTRTGELTLRAARLRLLTKALRPLPDKYHGLQDREERYRARQLDLLVNPESRAVFLARSRAIQALRRVLDSAGFLEVETPVLVPLAGGAAARPFLTYHNALERQLSLRIATELHLKRLVVGGFERVYEIGRVFRNEGLSTRRNPEFTSLEAYQAYAGYREMMALTEQLVHAADEAVNGAPGRFAAPFRRITMADAVREATGIDFSLLAADEVTIQAVRGAGYDAAGETWGALLAELFEAHAEQHLQEPTFVLQHPVESSPLARRDAADPRLTERFELYMGGREVANAFSELADPLDQRARFEAQLAERTAGNLEAHPLDEEFLAALEVGLPPTGGLGIGVDRLVMLLTGATAIRDVILFPTLREEAPGSSSPGDPLLSRK